MDGHEKIATRCTHAPPARGGRPRGDGSVKQANNGWFMLTDPDTGCIIGIEEMHEPENNSLALTCGPAVFGGRLRRARPHVFSFECRFQEAGAFGYQILVR